MNNEFYYNALGNKCHSWKSHFAMEVSHPMELYKDRIEHMGIPDEDFEILKEKIVKAFDATKEVEKCFLELSNKYYDVFDNEQAYREKTGKQLK